MELTTSQVKHNTARMRPAIIAAEGRQDTALCLTGDLKRHCEQAAAEKPCCCTCKTCFELGEIVCIGYTPYLRVLILPFVCLYCLWAWLKVKFDMLKEGSKAVNDADYTWNTYQRGGGSSSNPAEPVHGGSQISDPLLTGEPSEV